MLSPHLAGSVSSTGAMHTLVGLGGGQVKNQVGLVRARSFTPRLRVKSYDELNAWLLDQCVAYAQARPHLETRDQTIWSMFEAERQSVVP